MHVAWHASPQSLKKVPDMPPSLRKLAPALAVLTLVLAGCKTASQKDADAAPQPQANPPAPAAVVAYNVAPTQQGTGMRELKIAHSSQLVPPHPALPPPDPTQ